MRILMACGCCAALLPVVAAAAPDAFDPCSLFTRLDAEAVMQTSASPEAQGPGAAKPSKPVASCSYRGVKDGKAVEAMALFRFARNDAETQRAFDDARMRFQTKPLLISGEQAFWSAKTGELNVRKGRAWITLAVGPDKARERELEPARQLAEMLVKKL